MTTNTAHGGTAARNAVLLAGADPTQSVAWRAELLASGPWPVLGPVRTFAEARVLINRQQPAVLVCDLRLHDGTAIEMIRTLRAAPPQQRTQVVVVAQAQDTLLLDALQEGADNFFSCDDAAPGALTAHVGETLAGGADIAPWIARRLLDHFGVRDDDRREAVEQLIDPLSLTPTERFLLRRLSTGQRLAELARLEGVGQRVLAGHVRAIYRKMQWGLRAEGLALVSGWGELTSLGGRAVGATRTA
jgi:DNA-binding NarL/FixJ family response regulator